MPPLKGARNAGRIVAFMDWRATPERAIEESIVMENAIAPKRLLGFPVGLAVILILLGLLALARPFGAGIAVALLLGWAIVMAGIAHLVFAWSARHGSGVVWRLLIGLIYLLGGLYLIAQPALSLVSLTLFLAGLFFAQGIFLIVGYFQFRGKSGSTWLLIDGAATLVLAVLIGLNWPSSAEWAIGTLVGLNFLMSGFALLMWSLAVRNAR